MISFELDDNNNLVTGGNINTVSNNAALIQDYGTRVIYKCGVASSMWRRAKYK